jgi:hypothetical protein
MPGNPVTIGCAVTLTPGLSGPPDQGTIVMIPLGGPTAGHMPLAIAGSMCLMINSVWGFPYPMPIGALTPSQVTVAMRRLVRMGDMIQSGPGMLTVLGPPASPALFDRTG